MDNSATEIIIISSNTANNSITDRGSFIFSKKQLARQEKTQVRLSEASKV